MKRHRNGRLGNGPAFDSLEPRLLMDRAVADLAIASFLAPDRLDLGQEVARSLSLRVSGSQDALSDVSVGIYLSKDAVITANDILLTDGRQRYCLAPGDDDTLDRRLDLADAMRIPTDIPPGEYWLGALLDDRAELGEATRDDISAAVPVKIDRAPLPDQDPPDLYVSQISSRCEGTTGEPFAQYLTVVVGNMGGDVHLASGQSFGVGVYISPDPKIEPWDMKLGPSTQLYSLNGGTTVNVPLDPSLKIPLNLIPRQTYYIGALVDDTDVVKNEKFESNNSLSQAIVFDGPDLVVQSFQVDRSSAGPGQSIGDVTTLTIRNDYWGAAGPFTVGLYLSTNPKVTQYNGTLLWSVPVSGLKAFTSKQMTVPSVIKIPANIPPGQYYIGAVVDTAEAVNEHYENNNVSVRPITVTTDTWTVLAYLDGDCDREGAALGILDQLEQIPTAPGVHIVAMVDRHPNDKQDKSKFEDYTGISVPSAGPYAQNWSDTRWGFVQYDGKLGQWATKLSNLPGMSAELNVGSGNTLASFITMGMQLAPAQHYALIMFDHGGGQGGICWDSSSKILTASGPVDDGISMSELHQALQVAPYVDVMVLDACLMQQAEVATEMIGQVGYVVAAQSVTYSNYTAGSFFGYPHSLPLLAQDPTPKQLAQEILTWDTNHTLKGSAVSLLDLSGMAELNQRLDAFALCALDNAKGLDWNYLRDDRHLTTYYHFDILRDLRGYMSAVMNDTRLSDVKIRNAATAVYNYLAPWTSLIVDRTGPGNGISIFLPETSGDLFTYGYSGATLTFADRLAQYGTHWRNFLLKFPSTAGLLGTILKLFNSSGGDGLAGACEVGAQPGQQAVIDSAVEAPQDVQFYRFRASAGQVLYAQAQGDLGRGGLAPVLTVYGPDRRTVLAQAMADPNGLAALNALSLREEGDYYLAVTSAGNLDPLRPRRGESTGKYTLSMVFGEAAALAPRLDVRAREIDFGFVRAQKASEATVRLTNTGGTTLLITELATSDGSPFLGQYAAVGLPIRLAPGAWVDLSVGVRPEEPGDFADQLRIRSNDPVRPVQSVGLRARAAADVTFAREESPETLTRGQTGRAQWTGGAGGDTLDLWTFGPTGWQRLGQGIAAVGGQFEYDTGGLTQGWHVLAAAVQDGAETYTTLQTGWTAVVNALPRLRALGAQAAGTPAGQTAGFETEALASALTEAPALGEAAAAGEDPAPALTSTAGDGVPMLIGTTPAGGNEPEAISAGQESPAGTDSFQYAFGDNLLGQPFGEGWVGVL